MVAAGEGGAGSTGTTDRRRENEIICIFEVELQTKVGKDFTITEKAPTRGTDS